MSSFGCNALCHAAFCFFFATSMAGLETGEKIFMFTFTSFRHAMAMGHQFRSSMEKDPAECVLSSSSVSFES